MGLLKKHALRPQFLFCMTATQQIIPLHNRKICFLVMFIDSIFPTKTPEP